MIRAHVSAALMCLAVAAPGWADEKLAAVEAAAQANGRTPEGKAFEERLGTAFGRDQGATIQRCAKAVGRPDLQDFDLFVKLDVKGVVEEALVKPETNLSQCLQHRIVAWKAPAPPAPGFWAKLAVNLKPR